MQFHWRQCLNSASAVLLCILPSFLHDVTAPVLIVVSVISVLLIFIEVCRLVVLGY